MTQSEQAVVDTLRAQRNEALDTIARQNAHIADLGARIAELEAQIQRRAE